jgi:hypothetical protein
MSLHFDLTQCAFEGDPQISKALVFYCMALSLRGITESNWQTFALRMRFHDALFGTLLRSPEGDAPISDDDLRAHIGLTTNVDDEPTTRWANSMTKLWLEDQEQLIAARGNSRHLYASAPPPPAESDVCPLCDGDGSTGLAFEAGDVVERPCACVAQANADRDIPF